MRFAVLEGVADDALHTFTRVDVFLGGDFVRSSLLEDASAIGVNAFRVFAENYEVDVVRLDTFERAQRSIKQANRAYVRVKVHFEAHAEQDFFGMDVGFYPGIAESADQNGIVVTGEHGESLGRNRGLIPQVAVSTPVEILEFNRSSGCLDGLDRLWNNFLTDTVAGDDCDTLFTR